MPTNPNKIQVYLKEDVKKTLEDYRTTHNIENLSQAVNHALSLFFKLQNERNDLEYVKLDDYQATTKRLENQIDLLHYKYLETLNLLKEKDLTTTEQLPKPSELEGSQDDYSTTTQEVATTQEYQETTDRESSQDDTLTTTDIRSSQNDTLTTTEKLETTQDYQATTAESEEVATTEKKYSDKIAKNQKAMSKYSGVPQATISNWGKKEIMDEKMAEKFKHYVPEGWQYDYKYKTFFRDK